ncbi:MAG: hypothetical protein V1862_10885 [Methanobacteriota archaeon]
MKEEYQDHQEIPTLPKLLATLESDTSTILLIEYQLTWSWVGKPDQMRKFNEVCKKRAQNGGRYFPI